jgi:hypothetical protein
MGLSCAYCCAVLERCWTSLSAIPHSLDRWQSDRVKPCFKLSERKCESSRVEWSINVLLYCLISYVLNIRFLKLFSIFLRVLLYVFFILLFPSCILYSVYWINSNRKYPEWNFVCLPFQNKFYCEKIFKNFHFYFFFVVVVGLYDTAAMQAYCILTSPNEFHHSTPEAFHTKRRETPLLAKDGTKTQEWI